MNANNDWTGIVYDSGVVREYRSGLAGWILDVFFPRMKKVRESGYIAVSNDGRCLVSRDGVDWKPQPGAANTGQ